MSASDVIKQALVEHFAAQGLETKASHWKRRSKETLHEDYIAREFENDKASLKALAVTCDENDFPVEEPDEVCIWEVSPQIGYGVGVDDSQTFLTFVPMTQWDRNKTVPSLDDHIERGIAAIPLRYCGDDMGDNRFAVNDIAAVRRDLDGRGFVEIDELTQSLGG